MLRNLTSIVRGVLAVAILAGGLHAADIFVNPAATGANNGSSWTNARTSLQAALAAAVGGDRVLVIAGTYRPAAAGGATSSTFTVPAGVSVFGGLLGFENGVSCRNWQVNQTILSGDLNADDFGSYAAANAANRTDNCLRVVTLSTGSVIDGCIVQSGNGGGGITDFNRAATITNCWVRDNQGGIGAGINAINIGTVVSRTILEGNSGTSGVGMYSKAGSSIDRCVFRNNNATGFGGGLMIETNGPTLSNCLFVGNSAAKGGAISIGSGATPLFAYLTVTGNSASQNGGGMWIEGSSVVNVKNSLFDANTAAIASPDVETFSGTLSFFNSRSHISGSATVFATGNGNFSTTPTFNTPTDIRGDDLLWFTGDDKFIPATGAAQIGAGAAVGGITGDIRGSVRHATTPDVGAHERASNGTAFEIGLSSSPNGSAPVIFSSLTPTGIVGQVFSYRIGATNMAYALSGSPLAVFAFGISSGSLPAGLSLDVVTGLITGTPTTSGTSSVTVSATNFMGTTTATLSIGISAPPAITSSTTAAGTVGTAFSYQIVGSNSPTSYSAIGLPAGLAVNTSSGAITGTPSATGTSTITIGATNVSGTGTATLTLTVVNPPAPVITSSLTATGTVGVAFTYQITGSNSPTSFSATGLPTGLTVDAGTGVITGTPTGASSGTVTIGVTNAGGTGTAALALTISVPPPAPVIMSATTATAQTGVAFTYQITASNTPTSFSATGLPAGLSINTATGAITGSPTAIGVSSVTITATNAGGSGTATLTVTVSLAAPVITSATTATGTVGTAFSYQITASNTPTSFNATGLPTGLAVDTVTGLISGVPTATGATGVTISATNGTGPGSAILTITVAAAGGGGSSGESSSAGGSDGGGCGLGSGLGAMFGFSLLLGFRRRR